MGRSCPEAAHKPGVNITRKSLGRSYSVDARLISNCGAFVEFDLVRIFKPLRQLSLLCWVLQKLWYLHQWNTLLLTVLVQGLPCFGASIFQPVLALRLFPDPLEEFDVDFARSASNLSIFQVSVTMSDSFLMSAKVDAFFQSLSLT